MRAIPHHTPSQHWARKHGACESGRRDLGKRSILAHWRKGITLLTLYQLNWIAVRLGRETFLPHDSARFLEYVQQLDASDERFRKQPNRVEKTRNSMEAVMRRYGIRWPMEIL